MLEWDDYSLFGVIFFVSYLLYLMCVCGILNCGRFSIDYYVFCVFVFVFEYMVVGVFIVF